jgi:hypothetical protein
MFVKLREEYEPNVFENIILSKIFGLTRGWELREAYTKLRSEDFHDLYCAPNIRFIKKRKITLARYVAREGKRRSA